jgi:hypothetical protein
VIVMLLAVSNAYTTHTGTCANGNKNEAGKQTPGVKTDNQQQAERMTARAKQAHGLMLVLTADHTIRMGLTERHLKRRVRYSNGLQQTKQKRTAEVNPNLAKFGQNRRAQGLM